MSDAAPAAGASVLASAAFEENAADGTRRHPAATTLSDFIKMLNDGAFDQDCADKLADFAGTMEELGCDTGKKIKGKITLTVDVERDPDGAIYYFTPLLVTKLPPEKTRRTIGWLTAENHFTPNQPRQGNLFGTIRDVTHSARDVRGA